MEISEKEYNELQIYKSIVIDAVTAKISAMMEVEKVRV